MSALVLPRVGFATTTWVADDEPLSKASLAMHAYAEGDEAAFASVYDELAPRLLAYLTRRTRSVEMAEDVVQQTFLNMHRARSRFAPGSKVEPWAYAIARRLALDVARMQGRRIIVAPVDVDTVEGAGVSTGSPEDLARGSELEAALHRELAGTPALLREAFMLVRVEQLSVQDAADVLGITVAAAKVRVHRAGLRLRPRLAEFSKRSDEE